MDDYRNVVEIEAAIARLATLNPQLCTLLELPNKTETADGRISHALRISTAPGAGRDTLMVTAGLHACEWGTSEAAVIFATDVLRAYTEDAGLGYGNKVFAKEAIRAFVDMRDLVVFPQVNPDGRAYSQEHDLLEVAGWRKNRRLVEGRGSTAVYGVDVNRNFETAWEFRRLFIDDEAHVSDIPARDDYHGPKPFSEAESRNVQWLLDKHPTTRWLVDVHGPAESIQYNWGIDETQSDSEGKNFRNQDWDHQRGKRGDDYAEYRLLADSQLGEALARRMSDAVFAVRQKRWQAGPCFDTLYAVSGALIDYAYARQWAAPAAAPRPPPIHGFVIEHGRTYHPTWPVMAGVVDEICAALLELCVAIT